jgi:hypothetical protein
MTFDPTATRSGSIFSDVPNYAAAWVCYINGREVPILGFEVSYGVWQIPTFRIHCVPDVTIQRLGHEDRVPVQIFYLDEWANDTPTFRLLVDGEIVGWSFSSSSGSRAIVFSCIANIHIFQQLYFFYMTNVDDIVASRSPEVLAQGFSTPGLLYPYAIFHQGLLTTAAQAEAVTPRTQDQQAASNALATSEDAADTQEATALIKAPYELVTNVIKGCISSDVPNDRRAVPMMNFFARYIRKMRFHNRWVRLPIFEDAATLVDRQGVFPIFNAARSDQALIAMQRQVVSQVGNSGPVWNLFQQVLGLVYMDIAMIPNPACVQVQLAPAGPNQPEEGKILRLLDDRAATITTRRSVNQQQLRERANQIANELRRVLDSQVEIGPNLPIDSALLEEAGLTSTPANSSVIDEEQIFQTLLRRANEAAARNGDTDRTIVNPMEPIRLAQYAVKPQFLFGEVPACNVIMPSMIDSWTYDESYINQPTRIYVNDSVMTRLLRAQGSNREFMLHALTVGYPEEADALMHHRVASSANEGAGGAPGATESGRNLLIWPEEFYKGPVTARMSLPSWFQMLRQFANSQGAEENSTPQSTTSGQSAQLPANIVPLTTRSVEIPRSTTYDINNALIASTTDQTQATYASRVSLGNIVRVSLNGSPAPRFWLQTGGGLDPANYVIAQQTALWPLPPPRTTNRRGRQAQSDTAFERRSTVQKMAQMMRLLLPICRQAFSGLTEDQLFAVTFALYWVSFNEQGVTGYVSWALGNQKQYATSPVGHWTINPWDRQPYVAATSPQEGAQRFVNWLLHNQQMALRVLLTGRGSAEFNAFAASRGYTTNPFWQDYAPIRPDLYYIALGYGGYYNTEKVSDPEQRGDIGFARTRSQASFFTRIRSLFRENKIPPDVISERPFAGAVYRPLIREEDRPLLNWGRPRAQETVVTRRIPRIAASGQTALPGTANVGATQPNREGVPSGTAQQTVQGVTYGDVVNAQEETEGNQFARLFRLYAQYEYLKQRYSQRNAGANLRFNPYLVPGFPAMLFDSMRTRMHCVGYIQTIVHTGFATSGGVSMATTVQMSFCRTIHEFINDVRNDANRFAGRVTSAPAEIIDEIRVIIQDENRAEEFYQRFFYGGARPNRVPAVFRWDRVLGYARGLDVEEIQIIGDSVETLVARQQAVDAAIRAQANEEATAGAENTQPNPASANSSARAGGVSSEGQQTVRHNLDPNEELAPNPRTVYADAFDNYHVAMQLAARPVCTLEQYIRFWHGGRTINDLLVTGDVETPKFDFAYYNETVNDVVATGQAGTEIRAPTSRASAVYYERIFRLRPGPGSEPTVEQRGYTDPPNIQPSSTTAGVPADYPQTRADWDSVLELYVQKVRRMLSPGT